MLVEGKNGWYAIWNCDKQMYFIYCDGRFIITAHSMKQVKTYLN